MTFDEKTLHVVFSAMYLLFLFERGYFQFKAMRVSGEAEKLKKKKAVLIPVIILAQLWVVGSIIYVVKPTFMVWTRFPISPWARIVGAIIMASGMVLEFSTQVFLGRNYSTTLNINEKQTLVTGGPYRFVRHPMYTALFAVGVGIGLVPGSWYFYLPFVAAAVVIIRRIPKEEEAMIGKFGDEYVRYAQTTGRLLPRIKKS